MLVYVLDHNSYYLLNIRVQPDGLQVTREFQSGLSLIEGASEPHLVESKGEIPTTNWIK